MALTYKTKEGDTVDLIAWKHYGRQTNNVVEQVLEANPTLAEYGPTLPAGVSVVLPEVTSANTVAGVKLWD